MPSTANYKAKTLLKKKPSEIRSDGLVKELTVLKKWLMIDSEIYKFLI